MVATFSAKAPARRFGGTTTVALGRISGSAVVAVFARIESRWGIGHRSEAAVRRALAAVEARTK